MSSFQKRLMIRGYWDLKGEMKFWRNYTLSFEFLWEVFIGKGYKKR